jgi:ubiquinone/menaquinone biosynthesis C-methylase UbiE
MDTSGLDQNVSAYGVVEAESPSDELGVHLEELTRVGYTLLDSGLDANDVEELRTKLTAVYGRQAAEEGALEASDDADVARCLLAYETCFLDLATNPALLGFCRRVFGENFVLLQQNGVINRPSRAHYQARWHRDLPFQHWVASRPIAIAALLCLDPFNATTGGTYALPGSHKVEGFPSESFVRQHQQVMSARPGTFIVMDAMAFHRAGRNSSGDRRRGINHLIGLPFLAQQIDLPRALGGAHREDPFLSKYLGYRWAPAPSVEAWRKGRVRSDRDDNRPGSRRSFANRGWSFAGRERHIASRERTDVDRPAIDSYRCPYSGETLRFSGDETGDEITRGCLVSASGLKYPVIDGMPHLLLPERESYSPEEAREKEYYEATARSYDVVLDWLFESFYEDEAAVRRTMVDLLEVAPAHRVLETGAGTCRDTVEIARRLGRHGELYAQDLSFQMLSIGRDRMRDRGLLNGSCGRVDFSIGNAAHLPFPDGFFDSAYHFGGFNLFSDRRQALAEMARVVRIGGKVVVGDEGLAPWLRQAEYGAILMNSNRLYGYEPPVESVPECARDATVRWLIGNAFYVVAFRVGDGPPKVNLDLRIQGRRGGTHRTRYYGSLEGVTPEVKKMAEQAAEASGLSMHEWLDRAVRAVADGEKRS